MNEKETFAVLEDIEAVPYLSKGKQKVSRDLSSGADQRLMTMPREYMIVFLNSTTFGPDWTILISGESLECI